VPNAYQAGSEEAENVSELAAVTVDEGMAGLGHVGSDLLTAQGTQMRHYIRNFADA
jgi:serine/threonine-protein phosphatase 2B catalytic subunit